MTGQTSALAVLNAALITTEASANRGAPGSIFGAVAVVPQTL